MKQFDFVKIREFRESLGMTQEGLAIAMSTPENRVHKEQVSEWERETKGGLNVTTLVKLCNALNKSTDDFFIDNNVDPRTLI